MSHYEPQWTELASRVGSARLVIFASLRSRLGSARLVGGSRAELKRARAGSRASGYFSNPNGNRALACSQFCSLSHVITAVVVVTDILLALVLGVPRCAHNCF